jgi:hypothetical protein
VSILEPNTLISSTTFEWPRHQGKHCNFPCENQWTTHWYIYKTPWWEKILRVKEWTQYHWLSECGLLVAYLLVYWKCFETKFLMLFIENLWIFLINGSSCTKHGHIYVMFAWRPCLDYIYHLYTIYICLVAIQYVKFKFFQISSLLSLYGQRVLVGQTPAGPDNVRSAQTMSGWARVVFLLGLSFSHPNWRPPLQNSLLRWPDLPRVSKAAPQVPPPWEPSPSPPSRVLQSLSLQGEKSFFYPISQCMPF